MISKIIPESAIDYRGKYGPVIFMQGCNFKCGFCHNPEMTTMGGEESIDEIMQEIAKIKIRVDAGWYNGVCITGGEPTLHKNLPELISKLRAIGLSIKLDTNGSNPEMLKKLVEDRLVDYIAMDIKSSKELYNLFCGVRVDTNKIEESIKLLAESDIKFEFRTTFAPINGERFMNLEEVEEMAKWVSGLIGKKARWIIQPFISREKGEVLDDKYSKEVLKLEMHETPRELLQSYKEIIGKYFDAEIR
jgi:pyruvate formate lyase activating enzyme